MTGTKIIYVQDMIYAANKLMEFGAKNVLIKGGHSKNRIVNDVFVNILILRFWRLNISFISYR